MGGEPTSTVASGRQLGLLAAVIVVVAFSLRTPIVAVPPVVDDLHLSTAAETVLMTMPALLFGLLSVPATWVADRVGDEGGILMLLGVLLLAVVARWVDSIVVLFATTALACGAIAGLNCALPRVMGRRFPTGAGWITGAYTVSLALGSTAAAGLTVPFRDALDGSELAAMAAWGLPLAVGLLLWIFLMWRALTPLPPVVRDPAARSAWRDPFAWQIAIFLGLGSATYFAPLSWLPAIYREGGLSDAQAGGLLAVLNVAGIVSALVAPVLAGRRRDATWVMLWTVALTGLGVLGVLLAPATLPAVSAFLIGLGTGASLGLGLLLIVERSPAVAGLSPMSQTVAYTLAAIGPLAMGALHELSGNWTVPLIGLLVAVAGMLWSGVAAARARLALSASPAG